MRIRAATPADVAAIAALNVKAWKAAYRGHMPDAFLDELDPNKAAHGWVRVIEQATRHVLVATEADSLVGYCSMVSSRDADASPAAAELATIYVDPTRWRSGIGRALLTELLSVVREQAFTSLTLWVLTANARARAFYEAAGFVDDGATQINERFGFPLHETRYRRELAIGT